MRLTITVIGALALMAGAPVFPRAQQKSISSHPSEPLMAYLRSYLSQRGRVAPDTTTRITSVDVKTYGGNAEENIVYVSGQGWCGSGGCTMLILEPAGSSFKVLSKVTIVQLPIRLLPSVSHAHPDIGVIVSGGGIMPGYEAVLSFDGESYPRNPSLPPARKAAAIQG